MINEYLEKLTQPAQYSTDLTKLTLANLGHLACYKVSGEDAAEFLQGQFSNDIKNVTPVKAQLTSYCTPKGRMLATLYVCQFQGDYILLLSADIADEVMKRLQMYVMRSKVDISTPENISLMGICHDPSSTFIQALKLTSPKEHYDCSTSDSAVCIKIPGIQSRS